MSNITSSTLTNQQVTTLTGLVLRNLKDLCPLGISFFTNADAPEEPMNGKIPLYDCTSQIKGNAQKGQSVKTPIVGRLYARDKVENSPVSLSTASIETKTLTLNKHKHVAFMIEDYASLFDNIQLVEHLAKEQAYALLEAFEDDILALGTGFSTSVGSGDGSVMSFDTFAEVNRKFTLNKCPLIPGKREGHALVTPYQYEDLLIARDEHQLGGQKGLDQANKGWLIETPHGITIHQHPRIPVVSGASKGMVVTNEAIMFGFGIKPRIQQEYQLSALGTLHVADVVYGVAELRDEAGILLNFDSENV